MTQSQVQHMAANIITLARIVLAFVVIVLLQMGFYYRVAGVLLTILVIYLDSLDGYVARRLGVASDFGALFDITGDRIVEHVFWIFFSSVGLVSVWVPIIFISRSFLVDTLRSVAYAKEGRTPFGEKTLMRSAFTRFLTASPFSRTIYAVGKVVAFVLLGTLLVFQEGFAMLQHWVPPQRLGDLYLITELVVWVVVAMNLIRGIPVLIDGRFYLFERQFPRELKDEG
ncbi:MAG: CDP-alcohol phosphatidyltransferase family protein [Calditrichaeota bacterium]|nr:CDP-alcohol phosphatidyltransferase family protein [Calditrichota bacterium]